MSLKNTWLIWIPLILLLIFIFPKSCGFETPSKVLDYKCYGFKTPFFSEIKNTGNPMEWCSGICTSKLKITNSANQTNQTSEITPFSGISDSFSKVIPALLIVFIIIGLLKWVDSFKKRGGTEVRVYRTP